ncbi:MAG: four helix bundle protein, partial [Cyanobacteria bacterium J06628_4]
TDQVRRSSRSVCVNLAEAWRKRFYAAAFVAKLTDCAAEASETQTWIEANLIEPLPTYEWDAEGIPEGLPVRHVPGKGVMIVETDES